MKRIVIAIDGPAASGKTTTARLVAERLGYLHIDTGSMYRALALKVIEEGIDPSDRKRVENIVDATRVTVERRPNGVRTILDGRDVTEKLRSPRVAVAASSVSSIKKVREAMVKEQRRLGESGGVVLEGRDIGTVVFPDAELKIFLVANLEERARRRQEELGGESPKIDLGTLKAEISDRDRKDTTREASPLTKPPDAIEVDTSSLSIKQQVDLLVDKVNEIIQRAAETS